MLVSKDLFKIEEGEQNGLKAAQIAPKHGKKEKFSIGDFCCEKVKNVTKLRKDKGVLEVGVAVEDSPRSRPAMRRGRIVFTASVGCWA